MYFGAFKLSEHAADMIAAFGGYIQMDIVEFDVIGVITDESADIISGDSGSVDILILCIDFNICPPPPSRLDFFCRTTKNDKGYN